MKKKIVQVILRQCDLCAVNLWISQYRERSICLSEQEAYVRKNVFHDASSAMLSHIYNRRLYHVSFHSLYHKLLFVDIMTFLGAGFATFAANELKWLFQNSKPQFQIR
jgi:hypothetical protein